MSIDDELRDALSSSAPTVGDPAGVRASLRPAMQRARRRRKMRTTAAAISLTVAGVSGTAVAISALSSPDTTEIGPADSLPSPEDSTTTSTTTSTLPSATGVPTTGPELPSGPGTEADPDPAAPSTPSLTTAPPGPTTSGPPATVTTTTLTTPAPTTTVVAEPSQLSGPHTTDCGTLTLRYTSTSVDIEDVTVEPGYRFITEGEGTSELHAKWDEGPGEECQLEAHLEDGSLRIEDGGDHS